MSRVEASTKNKGVSYEPHNVPLQFVFGLSAVQVLFFVLLGVVISWLVRGISWYLVVVNVYTCEVLALLTHWLGHRRIPLWGFLQWYEAHTTGHHVDDYPARHFLSPSYEPAKQDNSWAYTGALFFTPFLASPSTVPCFLIAWATSYGMLIVADHIHMALHVSGHPWERYQWFQHLRSLHYFHHAGDMKRNYAIGDFFLDYMILGFKNVK